MDLQEIKTRMHTKKLYYTSDKRLVSEQLIHLDMLFEYNNLKPTQQNEKQQMLKKMFAEVGEDSYIETPFHASWGGKYVHLGNGVYANFNLTLVDDTDIFVGDNVMFAPNVTIITGTHPIKPDIRENKAQYNLPDKIGNNVWIGAGSIVMPGVTIGDNTVIGAGSIVTKDIPSNVVAYGSPCVVKRQISEREMKYYNKDMIVDLD